MPDCKKCADDPTWVCAGCEKDLWEYDPAYPAVEPHVAYKSLYVRIEGGYGMFFDTDFRTRPSFYGFYLCHECAHKFADAFPLVQKLTARGHIEDGAA